MKSGTHFRLRALAMVFVVCGPSNFAFAAVKNAKQIQGTLLEVGRVIVEPGDGWKERPKEFAIREVKSLVKLLSQLDLQDADPPPPCACRSEYDMKFYSGKKEAASVSNHNGLGLWWKEGDAWGYAKFPEGAVLAWRDWFSTHGYTLMDEVHRRDALREKWEKLHEEELQEFLRQFPESVRGLVYETDFAKSVGGGRTEKAVSDVARKVAAAFPDQAGMCIAVCRALGGLGTNGTGEAGWGTFEMKRYFAHDVARIIAGGDFETAVVRSKDNLRVMLGAAQLFFVGSFDEKVRKEAVPEIAAKLARITFENDLGENGDTVMRRLGKYVVGEPMELLRQVAFGEIKLPAVTRKSYEDAPSLRVSACIYLARNGHPDARKAIEMLAKRKPSKKDAAALDIARAFCGERGRITKAHFAFGSYASGENALIALERLGGTDSLGIIIEGGAQHPWAIVRGEAVLAAQRMTGAKWVPDGADPSMPASTDAARSWWAKNRADIGKMLK